MSDIIQLGSIQSDLKDAGTDNHGMGSDYYRRKQKPIEPYYVEKLDFDEAVQKEYPTRDFDVEQYIVDQAIQRGQDPNRPFQKTLRGLDWSRGNDKVRTEYWDSQGSKKRSRELAHYEPYGYNNQTGGVFKNLFNNLQYLGVIEPDPTIRMFNTNPYQTPYVHEFSHHLYNFQDNPPDPRKVVKLPTMSSSKESKNMDFWRTDPSEIQAEASAAKRDYVHRTVPFRREVAGEEYPWSLNNQDPNDKKVYDEVVDDLYEFHWGDKPFDKNHPVIKEGKPIPDEVMDDMFEDWMNRDGHGWGDAYRENPKEFPVELFKEALRLGKKDQKPGLFTGKRSYYA